MDCEDRDKISVSCLDLTYSVTYKITKKLKDEALDANETTAAIQISELDLGDEEDGKYSLVFKYCKYVSTLIDCVNSFWGWEVLLY